jgi:hypothetical protein
VEPQPSAFDRELEACTVFRRRAAQVVQEWPVDLLDVDAAILHGLDGAGDLHQLAGGGFRIGEGTERDLFHFCPASNFLAASNRCIFRIIAFVHRTDLQDSCVQREEGWIDIRPKILYSAQRVSYELGQGGKGPKATLVELISR